MMKLKAVEIDLLMYFQWNSKEKRQFQTLIKKNKWKLVPRLSIRKKREASEYEDLIQIWNEQWADQTLYYSIYSGKKKWEMGFAADLRKLPKNLKYFFEWGQDDSVSGTEFLSGLSCFGGFVVDPHWHVKRFSKLKVPLRFKLHGWNEERWVRRYGEKQSALIVRKILKYPKASLVLSYSGKVAESELFESIDALVLNF